MKTYYIGKKQVSAERLYNFLMREASERLIARTKKPYRKVPNPSDYKIDDFYYNLDEAIRIVSDDIDSTPHKKSFFETLGDIFYVCKLILMVLLACVGVLLLLTPIGWMMLLLIAIGGPKPAPAR